MSDVLTTAFKHHLWANLRLLDACEGLGDDILDAEVKGTYGSIRDTLLHLCAAEERYLSAVTGEAPAEPIAEGNFPGIEELKHRAGSSGKKLIAIVAAGGEDRIIRGEHPVRGKFAIPLSIFLSQAINHATEHRSHVCTILTQNHVDPPVLDVWTYVTESGRVDSEFER
jgi:uncharacterized damage-inducible protein DinB